VTHALQQQLPLPRTIPLRSIGSSAAPDLKPSGGAQKMKLYRRVAAFALLIALSGIPALAKDRERPEVPYVPTPEHVVAEMLKLAGVKQGDVLYDLGSGDGRIVIQAAKKYKVKGVGVDIDPERVKEARENARAAGVTNLASFRQNDLFKEDISEATVVTLYLLPEVNLRLKPKLFQELKPGTRIVSHSFDMGDWQPEKEVNVDGHMLYFWTIPANK
jgi:hypothetical protein